MPDLGDHLMVGWLGFEETRALATKGAIAGVFLSRRDFPSGASISDIRKSVDALQSARLGAGLPRLWIATDQEGGTVEKLSPPIPPIPALAKLIESAKPAETVRIVTEHAETQAKALAEAGINMNFAPVIDLMPSHAPGAFDFHSRIATRALSADPEKVALAGTAYVKAMQRHGITAILKHFPGLASVPADTHHFAATLDLPIAELEKLDWLPFREIANTTDAGVMLSHVRVTALDPDFPASGSSKVARLLREQMKLRGPLVTDDFSMAPIFYGPGGIDRAARRSMDAGVDLILISYDAEAVYDLLGTQIDQRGNNPGH
jgi:beta-N-acetylhexosaminidase